MSVELKTHFFSAKSANLPSVLRILTTPSDLAEARKIAISPFQKVSSLRFSTVRLIGRRQWFLKKK